MKPLISIIVPAFNEENTILKILNKLSDIRIWGYSFEIIVINDGSDDNTSNILSENNSLIDKYINNEMNFGKGYSVKKGLEIAEGKYVIFQDADILDKESNPLILVLAWNFFDEIKKNIKTITKNIINIKSLEKNEIN